MKKIFQVGAGLVGKTMALDLSKNYELHLGDTNLDLLNKIKNEDQSIHIQKIDIQDKKNFRENFFYLEYLFFVYVLIDLHF